MTDYTVRIERLREQMRADGVSGVVLAGTDQMRYLTGWQEGGHERFVGLLIPSQGEPAFLVPAMNAEQAIRTPAGISRIVGWNDASGWREDARILFRSWPSTDSILVDNELLSVHLLALQALFPDSRFSAAGETMARLRKIKTPEELDAMGRAAAMIDEVFEDVALQLWKGMTELQLASLVLDEIRVRGSLPSFKPLICFGPNAALPHHHTGDRPLQYGDVVVIDIGCIVDGYPSDITRTIAFGEPADPEAHRIYEIVFRAHHAARAAVRPGVSAETVDAAARNVIAGAGFGAQFLHRTGHGIGLSVHEPPDIVAGNSESLRPGMCFSVEPGIYLSGRFGVRIENIVTVADQGARSLNAEPDDHVRVVTPR